jgi:hypothetical protein
MKKCVIVDDYQGVALVYGDWNALADRGAVTRLREHIADEDAFVERRCRKLGGGARKGQTVDCAFRLPER